MLAGVDTLHVGFCAPDVRSRMQHLRTWLADLQARPKGERLVELGGREWVVGRGTEFAAAVLAHGATRVAVVREGLPDNAEVTVELGSQACHERGWQGAWRDAEELAGELLDREPERAKLSRVDPCVDVTDMDFARTEREDWVAKLRASKKRGPDGVADDDWLRWYAGSHPNSFLWGSRKTGACARVYDKVREVREKSGKTWFAPMWAQNNGGVIPSNVWRVEFEWKRQALRGEVWPASLRDRDAVGPGLPIDTVEGLERAIPYLWRVFTEERLRLCDPRGANRARWPLRGDWLEVVNVDWGRNAVPGGEWIGQRQLEVDLSKTLPQLVGQGIRAAALRGGSRLRDVFGGDMADLVECFMSERRRKWDAEVREKMAELGVPTRAAVELEAVA